MLDRDVLLNFRNTNQSIVQYLKQYSGEEWTIPSHVAWKSFQHYTGRSEMLQEQRHLQSAFGCILSFTEDTALEASYLDEKLQSQGVRLNAVDLFNLATAYADGETFVTHNKKTSTTGQSTASLM